MATRATFTLGGRDRSVVLAGPADGQHPREAPASSGIGVSRAPRHAGRGVAEPRRHPSPGGGTRNPARPLMGINADGRPGSCFLIKLPHVAMWHLWVPRIPSCGISKISFTAVTDGYAGPPLWPSCPTLTRSSRPAEALRLALELRYVKCASRPVDQTSRSVGHCDRRYLADTPGRTGLSRPTRSL